MIHDPQQPQQVVVFSLPAEALCHLHQARLERDLLKRAQSPHHLHLKTLVQLDYFYSSLNVEALAFCTDMQAKNNNRW